MKILEFNAEPSAIVPFLNAGRGQGLYYRDRLPVHVARVDHLPVGTTALVATADLQGRELIRPHSAQPPRLLGEVLPKQLVDEIFPQLEPLTGPIDPQSVGVLLGGDFYTVPALDKRGGTGDVTPVWRAFADAFQWVAGVAGNHDLFEEGRPKPRSLPQSVHYLDEQMVELGGLKIAGLGGIIGNPDRNHRRTEDDYPALCR